MHGVIVTDSSKWHNKLVPGSFSSILWSLWMLTYTPVKLEVGKTPNLDKMWW